jgi:FMN phosphatase YigB (HAD superfamily)
VPTSSRPSPRDFGHVETWEFDLDNTLYPHHLNLWQQVDDRIRAYVSDSESAEGRGVPFTEGLL